MLPEEADDGQLLHSRILLDEHDNSLFLPLTGRDKLLMWGTAPA